MSRSSCSSKENRSWRDKVNEAINWLRNHQRNYNPIVYETNTNQIMLCLDYAMKNADVC